MSSRINLKSKPKRLNVKIRNVFEEKPEEKIENEKEKLKASLHDYFEQGFSQGYKKAKTDMENDFKIKIARNYEQLQGIISKMDLKTLGYESIFEELVINLAYIIAEKIIRREIDKHPIFELTLNDSLKKVLGANNIIVKLNPDDHLNILSNGTGNLSRDSFSKIKFEPDDNIEPGGCLIETEIGNVDARISSQLVEIKKQLLNTL